MPPSAAPHPDPGRNRRALGSLLALVIVLAAIVVLVVTSHDQPASSRVIEAPTGSVDTVPFDASGRRPPGRSTWTSWPQALHDARHSGSATTIGPRRGTVVWQRHLSDGAVPSGPVLAEDGTIYVVDSDGTLHAVRTDDGTDAWSTDTGNPVTGDLSVSPLVLPDGDVAAADSAGLVAWSPRGDRRWGVRLADSLTSPITTGDGRVYVGSTSGMVYAIDVDHHHAHLAWRLDLRIDQSYGSLVTDGHRRLYQTSTDGIVAIDDTGPCASVAWRTNPHDGLVEVSPGLSRSGVVLLGTNGQHEWAYDHAGRLLWKAPRHITYSSPSVTEDRLAFVGEHNDQLHVFDVENGRQVGRFPTTVARVDGKTRVWTSIVVDAQHVFYFGTRTHFLVGQRPDGSRLFTTDLGASTSSYPTLTPDHALVIATDGGDLVKVD